jgi:hypothetical protein
MKNAQKDALEVAAAAIAALRDEREKRIIYENCCVGISEIIKDTYNLSSGEKMTSSRLKSMIEKIIKLVEFSVQAHADYENRKV